MKDAGRSGQSHIEPVGRLSLPAKRPASHAALADSGRHTLRATCGCDMRDDVGRLERNSPNNAIKRRSIDVLTKIKKRASRWHAARTHDRADAPFPLSSYNKTIA
ncbi:hypothetical protein EVAR_32555_1 [Eumeta japonica]|uniref:Uncharacterized protein n=1 Tax=Eumeta variegata TaxID=151549 RepID=A0A4C1VRT4_EUMVA|nr:hypothetical protein EVAR_32555_1 [Eumeta japonica]